MQAQHVVERKLAGLGVVIEVHETAVSLDAVESAKIGADPDRAGLILGECPDVVVAERLQIVGDVAPVLEMQSVGFEAVETRSFAAAPDAAFAIDQERRWTLLPPIEAGSAGSLRTPRS